MNNLNEYDFNETSNIGNDGVIIIKKYLESLESTIVYEDVQNVKEFQKNDIDLRLLNRDNNIISIEVKTDRYYNTGNFFFETISNQQKNTPGCFLYTKADYIYYIFLPEKLLYIIPVKESREWFLDNINSFITRPTSTENKYITIGKLVPRNIIMMNVNIEVIHL